MLEPHKSAHDSVTLLNESLHLPPPVPSSELPKIENGHSGSQTREGVGTTSAISFKLRVTTIPIAAFKT